MRYLQRSCVRSASRLAALAGGVLALQLVIATGGGRSAEVVDSPAPGGDHRFAAVPADDAGGSATIDPLSVNATCYVCHMTFVYEEVSKVHFENKVTCIDCHGLSAAHANDEHVGATKPDVTYRRGQIDTACSKKCHEEHDVPARKVLARWLQRQPLASPPVCTDCHGTHKIESAAEQGADAVAAVD